MGVARIRPAAAAAGAAVAALLAAGAVTATAASPDVIAHRPTTKESWTARVVVPVHTRAAPRAAARRTSKLQAVAPYNRGPHVLMVLAARKTRDGVWYRVQLNRRPNTAAGWIPAEAVRVTRTRYRVIVRLRERTVELRHAGRRIGRWTAAVGTSANPTPTGRFAVSEIVKQQRPGGFFGTYIITLTAHSERLSDFDGGDGRVALHGTNRAGLLGQAVSHGCVRLANPVATRIGRTVPAGAPVDILP